MISSVYQYYMSQYGHRVNAKHDSHTKTQLKNTYGKVVKINSRTPTYKPDVSEAAQKYAIDLKENARELINIADELSNTENGTISYRKNAISSDDSAVHAEYLRNSTEPDAEGFDIQVSQLATKQINTGNFLQPAKMLVAPGTYSFDLGINDLTYEFEFDVAEHEATSDIQDKISRLINRSNIGLHSEIATDSLGNTALSISSDATGLTDSKHATIFRIEPNPDSGNNENQDLINTLGLNRVAQYPSNAVLEINGQRKISPSNEFTISKAYAVTLKSVTDSPVQIGLQANADSVSESISELMSGYNNMISVTMNAGNNQFEGNAKLQKEFQSIARFYRDELNKNGIIVQDSGQIEVDKEKISAAAENNTLGDVFKSLDSFKKAIQKKADSIALNPMNYVNNKIVAYKNPQRPTTDPYNISAYTGMMFNGYI